MPQPDIAALIGRSVGAGTEALFERFALSLPPAGRPVFVMASGWRSGSTLLQRLIVSSGEVFMWGEPYDHTGTIRSLADTMSAFDEEWPPLRTIVDPGTPPGADKWIANAYPHPSDLVAAHRAFFDRFFGEPAAAAGLVRWGVKGVRLSGEHARYLSKILPDASFVFLHRNPYDAFLSYRLLHEIRPNSFWWYWRWPDVQVEDARLFAEMWRGLTETHLAAADNLDARVVRYADVIDGSALDPLEAWLGITIDRSVLSDRVGGTAQQRGQWEGVDRSLRPEERAAIDEVAGELAAALGYHGPGDAAP